MLQQIAFGLLLVANAALADTPTPATAAAPPTPPVPGESCKKAEYHQFDFWLGEWDVTTRGQPAGRSRIDAILLNCALNENWSGAQGGNGKSYNAYDPRTKQWQQFWVSEQGNTLLLRGGLQGASMVMTGEHPSPQDGKPQQERITWTPGADGSVRQLWEQSNDGGKTWAIAFDGLYRHKK
jgi:hypothetical protein